jgi:hypothetical protein
MNHAYVVQMTLAEFAAKTYMTSISSEVLTQWLRTRDEKFYERVTFVSSYLGDVPYIRLSGKRVMWRMIDCDGNSAYLCTDKLLEYPNEEIFIQLEPSGQCDWWDEALRTNGRESSASGPSVCEDACVSDASPEVEAALIYIAINQALDRHDFEEVKRLRDQIRPLVVCCS